MSGISLVRLGKGFDGGYLIPEKVLNICDTLISLGYGYDCSFEREFLKLSANNNVIIYDIDITLFSGLRKLIKDFKLMIRLDRPYHYRNFF